MHNIIIKQYKKCTQTYMYGAHAHFHLHLHLPQIPSPSKTLLANLQIQFCKGLGPATPTLTITFLSQRLICSKDVYTAAECTVGHCLPKLVGTTACSDH